MSNDSWHQGVNYNPYSLPGVDSKESRDKDSCLLHDDSNYTFRVNSELKAEFLKLCKSEHYSAASALKRYMQRCVEKGSVTHDFRKIGL